MYQEPKEKRKQSDTAYKHALTEAQWKLLYTIQSICQIKTHLVRSMIFSERDTLLTDYQDKNSNDRRRKKAERIRDGNWEGIMPEIELDAKGNQSSQNRSECRERQEDLNAIHKIACFVATGLLTARKPTGFRPDATTIFAMFEHMEKRVYAHDRVAILKAQHYEKVKIDRALYHAILQPLVLKMLEPTTTKLTYGLFSFKGLTASRKIHVATTEDLLEDYGLDKYIEFNGSKAFTLKRNVIMGDLWVLDCLLLALNSNLKHAFHKQLHAYFGDVRPENERKYCQPLKLKQGSIHFFIRSTKIGKRTWYDLGYNEKAAGGAFKKESMLSMGGAATLLKRPVNQARDLLFETIKRSDRGLITSESIYRPSLYSKA